MSKNRIVRLNSLLKEVISEVIHRDIHHVPFINEFVTVTRVEITNDLSFAKVYVSILGEERQKKQSLEALQKLSKTIGYMSSKKMVIRYFPELIFELDIGLEKQLRIEEILLKESKERQERESLE
jgi:ribosome-binding factor A